MVKNLQWQVATILLLFPFIPMSVQLVFMHTPWTWYAASGCAGLFIFVRIMMVQGARAALAQTEAAYDLGEEDE